MGVVQGERRGERGLGGFEVKHPRGVGGHPEGDAVEGVAAPGTDATGVARAGGSPAEGGGKTFARDVDEAALGRGGLGAVPAQHHAPLGDDDRAGRGCALPVVAASFDEGRRAARVDLVEQHRPGRQSRGLDVERRAAACGTELRAQGDAVDGARGRDAGGRRPGSVSARPCRPRRGGPRRRAGPRPGATTGARRRCRRCRGRCPPRRRAGGDGRPCRATWPR
jgi:hypothetical protein